MKWSDVLEKAIIFWNYGPLLACWPFRKHRKTETLQVKTGLLN
jgi:hypothetical protein